ncbi:hypothetical protein K7432_011659 [Basidiobolus ranarum]|uniref:Uncharacterized protein n=1 Tax=Basidiobolus ranarum TaxID=34480 RepID=A0ABR2WM26_9FUNG
MISNKETKTLFETPQPPPYTRNSPEQNRATTAATFTRPLSPNQRPNSVCVDLSDVNFTSTLDRKTIAQAAEARKRFSAITLTRRSSRLTLSVTIEEMATWGTQEEQIPLNTSNPDIYYDDMYAENISNDNTLQSIENSSSEILVNALEQSPTLGDCNYDFSFNKIIDFCFIGKPIDMALRKFLAYYDLPKEAQQIDRVMQAFSLKYHSENPHLFLHPDIVYSVAFSLMLLHTDAHNKHVKRKMSKQQYVRQTRMVEQGDIIAPEILEILYDNITTVEFSHGDLFSPNNKSKSSRASWFRKILEKNPTVRSPYDVSTKYETDMLASKVSVFEPERCQYSYRGCQSIIREAFLKTAFRLKSSSIVASSLPNHLETNDSQNLPSFKIFHENDDPFSILKCIKAGPLRRKCDLTHGGKRANIRSWKPLWMVLSGNQLIFFPEGLSKDSKRTSSHILDTNRISSIKPHSTISIDNCIGLIDRDYNTYPYVFRFVTPNKQQYLFRFDSEREMIDWMAKINYVATFSTIELKPRGDELVKMKILEFSSSEIAENELQRRILVQVIR